MKQDLTKEQLYNSVKALIENSNPHIHLNQHKLYTLVSLAFQYILFQSTKNPGYYIIRVEDHGLLDKMIRKAKDPTTRKFLRQISDSRKFKYGQSTFFLDYFQMSSWAQTNDLAKDKVKAALIVKNASATPLSDSPYLQELGEIRSEGNEISDEYYITSLQEFAPKTIAVAYEVQYEKSVPMHFDWIKKEETALSGVKISKSISFNE